MDTKNNLDTLWSTGDNCRKYVLIIFYCFKYYVIDMHQMFPTEVAVRIIWFYFQRHKKQTLPSVSVIVWKYFVFPCLTQMCNNSSVKQIQPVMFNVLLQGPTKNSDACLRAITAGSEFSVVSYFFKLLWNLVYCRMLHILNSSKKNFNKLTSIDWNCWKCVLKCVTHFFLLL